MAESSAELEFTKVTDTGFHVAYDEGVGINGLFLDVDGKFEGERVVFGGLPPDQCRWVFALSADRKTMAQVDPQCSLTQMTEIPGDVKWVRSGTPVYFKTSFDCSKAGTNVEKAVCSSEEIANADVRLSSLYGSLSKSLPDAKKATLRQTQREWVAQRNKACEGKSKEDLYTCVLNAYVMRLLALAGGDNPVYDEALGRFSVKNLQRALTGRREAGIVPGLLNFFSSRTSMDVFNYELSNQEAGDGLAWSGCFVPDPRKGHDPARMNCEERGTLLIDGQGQPWAVQSLAQDDQVTVTLWAPPGRTLAQAPPPIRASIQEYQRAQKQPSEPNIAVLRP